MVINGLENNMNVWNGCSRLLLLMWSKYLTVIADIQFLLFLRYIKVNI